MSTSDPIGDLLTRIRNAILARHEVLEIAASRQVQAVAQILVEEGFIKDVTLLDAKPQGVLRIELKYFSDGTNAITGLERISKPGRRVYCAADDLPRVRGGLGLAVVSTSRGVVPDRTARKLGVGGELMCSVW